MLVEIVSGTVVVVGASAVIVLDWTDADVVGLATVVESACKVVGCARLVVADTHGIVVVTVSVVVVVLG